MASFERRPARGLFVAGVACLALVLAACGSSNNNNTSSSGGGGGGGGGGKEGGTATVVIGTAPDYMDPSVSYTSQAYELNWITHLGLLTYKHAPGSAGGALIPGLAQDLPQISSDGKTYTFTLRQGLKYSDGTPVKASDFIRTMERTIRLNWGGKSFITGYVSGAAAYDSKKATKISGLTADDSSGKITIHLDKAYGAFGNVIAFPNLGFVP